MHGENDSNVPVSEAEQVVTVARARNIAVNYLLFAGEGHELTQIQSRETLSTRQSLGSRGGSRDRATDSVGLDPTVVSPATIWPLAFARRVISYRSYRNDY